MPTITTQQPVEVQPHPDHGVSALHAPPPAGSLEELAETVLVVGYPGAFSLTCRTVEQLIRTKLLWQC